MIARGGPGGRGNKRFAGPTHQTPRFAERGLPGDETWVTLRLKLLADAGLIGLPNAGKSSLLSRLTRAHPKVADYPFTTLEPALGTLDADDRQLVIADIPGLIEGASAGAGLGHEFLAHVERTRLLVHVLDLAPLDGSDPADNFAAIEHELALHDPRLAALPRILALSKADLVDDADARTPARPLGAAARARGPGDRHLGGGPDRPRRARARADPADPGSAGRDRHRCTRWRRRRPRATASSPSTACFVPPASAASRYSGPGRGAIACRGKGIERLVARYDLDNEDALAHLERRLRGIGVIAALESKGFEPGDEVEIAGVLFDLDPSTLSLRARDLEH